MINNATNINKASNHLSPENNWTHKVHDIWHRHQGPGFGQAQKYRRVKPVDRISALPPPEKTSDLPQVTDKLYHIALLWEGFQLTTLVVIGTDYTFSCKSNHHTIATMMAPRKRQALYINHRTCGRSEVFSGSSCFLHR
jgi:hypothetical protein